MFAQFVFMERSKSGRFRHYKCLHVYTEVQQGRYSVKNDHIFLFR